MDEFKNPNGTYNGIRMLAALSGLEEREIKWCADRLKQLLVVEGKPQDEAKAIVKREAATKPWLVG